MSLERILDSPWGPGYRFHTVQIMDGDLASFLCENDLGCNLFVGVWLLQPRWSMHFGRHPETEHLGDTGEEFILR